MMKDFKSFSDAIKHEMGERGYESEKEEGHGDLKGHPSINQIAKKHNITPEQVISQIKKGYKLEKEHTNNIDMAIDIAMQHVNEFPTYYDKLIKMEADLKKSHSKYKDNPIKESVEDNRRMLGGERYCPLCRKFETQSECSYGPNIWNKFSIATVHPTNEEKGLWDNIHARRKKGLPRKKPGQKGYPKTLDIEEGLKQARKNVGASKCWTNKKIGNPPTKMKNGKEVPNCVPESGDKNESQQLLTFDQFCEIIENFQFDEQAPAWQRKEGKNPEGGLNQKGVNSYRKENPGSKLKTAVTTEPSKLKPGSKSANRRKSFCSRMSGMKAKLTSAKTAHDPNSRINKSLRKWNC